MIVTKTAVYEDKQQLRKMWEECFNDSESFLNWFFENRFAPSYCAYTAEDEKIISAMHAMPCSYKIRNSALYCVLVSGVSTLQPYRGHGYMAKTYKFFMREMYKRGFVLCTNRPVDFKIYYSLGHYPCADIKFLEIERSEGGKNICFKQVEMKKYKSVLYDCYVKAAESFSCIIQRSLADFSLKTDDYASDGGKCIACIKEGRVLAYAIYYVYDETLYGEEIMAVNGDYEQKAVDALMDVGRGLKMVLKVPASSSSYINGGTEKIKSRSVFALINAEKLLKALGKNLNVAILIKDDIIEENNGVFDMCGKKCQTKEPKIEMMSFALVQWLTGYKSLGELEKDGVVKINDRDVAEMLEEQFTKQNCHSIDEY